MAQALNSWRGSFRTLVLLAGAISLAGCQTSETVPMPGVLPSTGMLLKCVKTPLSSSYRLDVCQIYRSPYGNGIYPFNIASASPAEKILGRLYRRNGLSAWTFLDFADLPKAQPNNCPSVSHDGRLLLYMSPDVSRQEGDYPRQYPTDRRTYRVFLYDSLQGVKFSLDQYCRVYSLGWACQWRRDDSAIGFTAVCSSDAGAVGQLVVTDPYGNVLLDASRQGDLVGLEFVAFSPDGQTVAALRPANSQAGAKDGGELVEVDIESATLRSAGQISPTLACRYIEHIERLIEWTPEGLALRPVDRHD